MPTDYYPIPPSFGALLKRKGSEHAIIEELIKLNSYEEALRRYPDYDWQSIGTIKKLMEQYKVSTFQALTKTLYFREFVEILSVENIIPRTTLLESIQQNIFLYLSSKPNEYYFDSGYGCIIHDFDFRQLRETSGKDKIKSTVEEYLGKFEKRITVNKVDIEITDVEERVDGNNPKICRYIQIVIASTLIQTKEKLKEMKFRMVRYS